MYLTFDETNAHWSCEWSLSIYLKWNHNLTMFYIRTKMEGFKLLVQQHTFSRFRWLLSHLKVKIFYDCGDTWKNCRKRPSLKGGMRKFFCGNVEILFFTIWCLWYWYSSTTDTFQKLRLTKWNVTTLISREVIIFFAALIAPSLDLMHCLQALRYKELQ